MVTMRAAARRHRRRMLSHAARAACQLLEPRVLLSVVPGNDVLQTIENTPIQISSDTLLSNDANQTGMTGYTQPSHGSLTGSPGGLLTYTPTAGFTGTDAFTYTVNGPSAPAMILTLIPHTGTAGEVKVTSFQWSESTVIPSGPGAPAVTMTDMQLAIDPNLATPGILAAVAGGQAFSAVLRRYDDSGRAFNSWILSNATLTVDSLNINSDDATLHGPEFITIHSQIVTESWQLFDHSGQALPAITTTYNGQTNQTSPASPVRLTAPAGAAFVLGIHTTAGTSTLPLTSFEFGASVDLSVSQGGVHSSAPDFSKITLTTPSGANSPTLLAAALGKSGQIDGNIFISWRDTQGQEIGRWELTGASFDSFATSANAQDGSDTLSLSYSQVDFTVKSDATINQARWDLPTHTGSSAPNFGGIHIQPAPKSIILTLDAPNGGQGGDVLVDAASWGVHSDGFKSQTDALHLSLRAGLASPGFMNALTKQGRLSGSLKFYDSRGRLYRQLEVDSALLTGWTTNMGASGWPLTDGVDLTLLKSELTTFTFNGTNPEATAITRGTYDDLSKSFNSENGPSASTVGQDLVLTLVNNTRTLTIPILSFSWDSERVPTFDGFKFLPGNFTFSGMNLMLAASDAAPELIAEVLSGNTFTTATLAWRRSTDHHDEESTIWTFKLPRFSQYQMSLTVDSSTESLSLTTDTGFHETHEASDERGNPVQQVIDYDLDKEEIQTSPLVLDEVPQIGKHPGSLLLIAGSSVVLELGSAMWNMDAAGDPAKITLTSPGGANSLFLYSNMIRNKSLQGLTVAQTDWLGHITHSWKFDDAVVSEFKEFFGGNGTPRDTFSLVFDAVTYKRSTYDDQGLLLDSTQTIWSRTETPTVAPLVTDPLPGKPKLLLTLSNGGTTVALPIVNVQNTLAHPPAINGQAQPVAGNMVFSAYTGLLGPMLAGSLLTSDFHITTATLDWLSLDGDSSLHWNLVHPHIRSLFTSMSANSDPIDVFTLSYDGLAETFQTPDGTKSGSWNPNTPTNLNFAGTHIDLPPTSATATVNITVADAPLSSIALDAPALATQVAVEGQTPSNVVLARFSDPAADGTTTDYSAKITWTDSVNGTHSSVGTISYIGNNTYQVTGSGKFLYSAPGDFAFSTLIADVGGSTLTVTGTIHVNDAPLSAVPLDAPALATQSTVEGQPATSVILARFADPAADGATTEYSATVTWTDSAGATHSSAAAISYISGTTYQVTGSSPFAYAELGSFPFSVLIADVGGSTLTASGEITVADATLVASGGFTFSATEGNLSAPQVVATFQDPGGPEAISLYSAVIDWGDGSTSSGVITLAGATFSVKGAHTYADQGSYSIHTTVSHNATPPQTVSATANVADAPITATGTSLNLLAGTPFNGQVAAFSDGNPNAPLSDFTATITWGDGSTSSGTITALGSGNFSVAGSHTFAAAGNFSATIQILDVGGSTASANTSIAVAPLDTTIPQGQIQSAAFWQGPAGQALIQSFNGGPNATILGNWLATNFPGLFGNPPAAAAAKGASGKSNGPGKPTVPDPTGLLSTAGLTNAQIAALLKSLSTTPHRRLEYLVFTAALNVYASSSALAGTLKGSPIAQTPGGIGAAQINVANWGEAVDAPDKSKLSVITILQRITGHSTNGILYGPKKKLRHEAANLIRSFLTPRNQDAHNPR